MQPESNLFKWGHRVYCPLRHCESHPCCNKEASVVSSVVWTFRNIFLHLLLKNTPTFSSLPWVQIMLLWILLDIFLGHKCVHFSRVCTHLGAELLDGRLYQFILPPAVCMRSSRSLLRMISLFHLSSWWEYNITTVLIFTFLIEMI